jgi:hypothetical protein
MFKKNISEIKGAERPLFLCLVRILRNYVTTKSGVGAALVVDF